MRRLRQWCQCFAAYEWVTHCGCRVVTQHYVDKRTGLACEAVVLSN